MLKKPEKIFLIDTALIIFTLVCIITGVILHIKPRFSMGIDYRVLHIWIGYIMTGIILVHLLMHIKWIKIVSKNIFSDKKKVIALASVVAVSLAICFLIEIITPAPKGNFKNGDSPQNFNRKNFKNENRDVPKLQGDDGTSF